MPATAAIRVALPGDLPRVARTLAEAFDDDPVWTWLQPGGMPSRQRLFGAILRHALPSGHVHTTTDFSAVAMWSPPGAWKIPLPAMVRAVPDIVRAAGIHLPRVMRRLDEIERWHERVPPRHWYLDFIGTTPAARGRGLGSALLDHAFARLVGDLPVYLESSNPRNLPFYQRHGFVVTGQPPTRSGPPQWTLWRE